MLPDKMVTDRTQADVAQNTERGSYGASDLNRVGRAVNYLAAKFRTLGFTVPSSLIGKTDWTDIDLPTYDQLVLYIGNVRDLQKILGSTPGMPIVPPDVWNLTFSEANDIEKALETIDRTITITERGLFYAGEIYAGEV